MKKPLRIKRGNDGEIFQHSEKEFGISWMTQGNWGFQQQITGLSKRELLKIADKIYQFIESEQ